MIYNSPKRNLVSIHYIYIDKEIRITGLFRGLYSARTRPWLSAAVQRSLLCHDQTLTERGCCAVITASHTSPQPHCFCARSIRIEADQRRQLWTDCNGARESWELALTRCQQYCSVYNVHQQLAVAIFKLYCIGHSFVGQVQGIKMSTYLCFSFSLLVKIHLKSAKEKTANA